ncbi:MAG: hypothetical protein AAF652_10980 [Cyanobacteria bacterium P01_C01_bin.72]
MIFSTVVLVTICFVLAMATTFSMALAVMIFSLVTAVMNDSTVAAAMTLF